MDLYLKRATIQQWEILFNWTNEQEVRKNSFNEQLVDYEDHIRWFSSKLNSSSSYIFICYHKETPVGVVRIELERESGVISYSVDKEFRGKGVASSMLQLLEEEIKKNNININTLIGFVKFHNIPSQYIFKKLMYKEIKKESCFEYKKHI